MGFDIISAIMALLSVLSFGAIGGADITDEEVVIPVVSDVPDTPPEVSVPDTPEEPAVSEPESPQVSDTPPPAAEPVPAVLPGADLIAGTWKGKASVPFVASVSFHAEIAKDGTAQFSGDVASSMFGDSTFATPASWQYLGGTSFNTVIEGTDTKITCDGTKLTFPANPYKLGLVDSEMANQDFIIDLYRA